MFFQKWLSDALRMLGTAFIVLAIAGHLWSDADSTRLLLLGGGGVVFLGISLAVLLIRRDG